MKKLGILSLLVLLVFSACRKDVDVITVDNTQTEPIEIEYVPEVNLVIGTVIGVVEDESYQPVSEANVTMNGITTTTDAYGHFFFNNIEMNSLGTFVKIEKDGYFLGSRRFFPQEDANSRVTVQLIEKEFSQSFSSVEGAVVEVGEGGSLQFLPNSIRHEDGTAYSGNVNIATHWLNPTDFDTYQQMPGNLQGVNDLNAEVSLATYGMLVAELESDAGEPLNVVAGSPAKMTMNIPDVLLANAPEEIPLWSFHEDLGMWVQESSAILEGGSYVGDLPHFSFWNCDFPYPLVTIDFTLVDELGNPIPYQGVIITLENYEFNSVGYGSSNEVGFVSGKVPMDWNLSLSVYGICGEILYTEALGSFSEDTSLGTIVVPAENVVLTNITGSLVDCDGNTFQNGVARAQYAGRTAYDYTNGEDFNISIITCPDVTEIEVIGSDLTNLLESETFSATPFITNDLGIISVCSEPIENYFLIEVDGVTKIYTGVNVQIGDFTFMSVFGETLQIGTGFGGSSVGDYSGEGENFENYIYDTDNNWNIGGSINDYQVTTFDTKVIGNYTAEMINNIDPNNPVQVNVSFYFNVNL